MAYNSNSLSNSISVNKVVTKSIVYKWNSIKDLLISKHLLSSPYVISAVVAEKYKFDLYGLFRNELNLPDYQIYPHILVNGYTCSTDYYGERLAFKLIDGEILGRYDRMCIR